jgi:hypothetical protein
MIWPEFSNSQMQFGKTNFVKTFRIDCVKRISGKVLATANIYFDIFITVYIADTCR